jgi:hypothetical protein
LAITALDLLADPTKLEAAKMAFEESKRNQADAGA